MKTIAYSVKSFEKEPLAIANHKKHDITLISNSLNTETVHFSEGKEAVVVFTCDDLSAPIIEKLAAFGVKYIATRSTGTDHIDCEAAAKHSIKVANVPSYSPQAIAEEAVALAMALSRKLVPTANAVKNFDFTIEQHMGFNFSGKTVGIVGLGNIGKATAQIFNGLGCKVIGYDINFPADAEKIKQVTFDELLAQADIISLHAPLTTATKHLINAETIAQMKKGVMLINTSRGGLVDTKAIIHGLKNGIIGYLGLDVYENEKGLFFENHQSDKQKDNLVQQLLDLPNVLITPHQGFLTVEALQQIMLQTIKNLDQWQENKSVGTACACSKSDVDKPVKSSY